MLSYWEKTSLLHFDVVILGSGIVGLSTAISIKEANPNLTVGILERGILPTGASTKNAGFACIGSLTEILDDLKSMSEDDVLTLVQMRREGLLKLRNRLGDHAIDYAENGSHELIFEKEVSALDQMQKINQWLKPILGEDAFSLANHKISNFGFQGVSALVENRFEGEIDTGKTMLALIERAGQLGVRIHTGCEIETLEEDEKGVKLYAKHIYINEVIGFSARKAIVCTNAFSGKFFPTEELKPGRGQIIITKPIPGLKVKGVFHFEQGYFYFRELGGRILFGGGRNMDSNEEETTTFEYNERILNSLEEKLNTIILPGTSYEIDYAWTGIMAFGETKFPIVKQVSKHILVGIRMGGMGVAIGSDVGDKLALKTLELV